MQWGRVHITAFERKLSIDSVPGKLLHILVGFPSVFAYLSLLDCSTGLWLMLRQSLATLALTELLHV